MPLRQAGPLDDAQRETVVASNGVGTASFYRTGISEGDFRDTRPPLLLRILSMYLAEEAAEGLCSGRAVQHAGSRLRRRRSAAQRLNGQGDGTTDAAARTERRTKAAHRQPPRAQRLCQGTGPRGPALRRERRKQNRTWTDPAAARREDPDFMVQGEHVGRGVGRREGGGDVDVNELLHDARDRRAAPSPRVS